VIHSSISVDMSPIETLSVLDTKYRFYIRDPKNRFKISRFITLSKKK